MLCGGNSNNPDDIFRHVVCINFYLERGNWKHLASNWFPMLYRLASFCFILLHYASFCLFPFFLSNNGIHMKKRKRINYIGEL